MVPRVRVVRKPARRRIERIPRFWVLWSTATEWCRALNAFCICEQRSCGRGIANEAFVLVVAVVCSNELEIQFGLLLVAGAAGRDAAKHSPPRRSQSGCGAGPGSQWVESNAAVIRKHLIFSHTTISHAYYHIPSYFPAYPSPIAHDYTKCATSRNSSPTSTSLIHDFLF